MNNNFNAATDKAIFDAMCQHKVVKDEIIELFFSRGIIVSRKTDKEDLAKIFSSYYHSYYDYDRLSTILGINKRKERLTSLELQTSLSIEEIENSVSKIKAKIQEIGATAEHTVVKANQKIRFNITYQVLNYAKSEFQQLSIRDAEIVIEKSTNGLNIRGPQNTKVQEVNNIIIDMLEGIDSDLYSEAVDLSAVEKPSARSGFFTKLCENMDKFTFKTVTDVFFTILRKALQMTKIRKYILQMLL